MFIFKKKIKNVWCKYQVCSFEYPVIITDRDNENNLIDDINNTIYEDITSFGDFFNIQLEDQEVEKNTLINAATEYRVGFSNNSIVSIAIEFSQFIGLNYISYINTYNYDIDLCREIVIEDIFDAKKDYLVCISKEILNSIEKDTYIYEEELESSELEMLDRIKDLITDNFESKENYRNFYIEEDGIVICFSSYEIIRDNPILLEFKIFFEDFYDYLSEYTRSKLLGE